MSVQVSLDVDDLVVQARKSCGLDDFGADIGFMQALRLMLKSLHEEADLHQQGRAMMRERVVNLLVNRLRVEDFFQRFPEIEEERVADPLVIVALPRTGTTMMHRFIASDPRIYAAKWYECRYPVPFPGWQPGNSEDARIPAAQDEVAMMLQAYPGLDAIHPMEALGADEEIMLLEHTFCSGMPQSMANVPSYAAWERAADHRAAYRYLQRLLKFLQWQKLKAGQNCQRWVLKAPEHLGYVEALLEVFPAATIIQSHRDPLVTIPSLCSFIMSAWAAYASAPDAHEIGRQWSERFSVFTRRTLEFRERHADRFIDIWYEDAVANPMQVAANLYRQVGMTLDEGAREAMQRWRDENRRETRAPHDYSLEQFGLSVEQIERDFSEYRQAYILSRPSND